MSRFNFALANRVFQKRAFVPSQGAAGGDPSGGGGGPPPDPSMGGGPPPGPPPDPSMGGGGGPPPGPPPDPSGGGGGAPPPPPPGPPPMDPSMMMAGSMAGGTGAGGGLGDVIQNAMTNALTQAGLMGKGGMGPNGKPTAPKPDINTIATDVFQLKKMFLHFCKVQGVELPPDILDGPNRDPLTGAPAASPTGGSEVQPGASAMGAGGDAGGGGPSSAIPPVDPMQGAFPQPPGMGGGGGGGGAGGIKAGSVRRVGDGYPRRDFVNKAAAVTRMIRQRQRS